MAYKLTYFNARGVAEQIRILFAISKTQYEDFRYNIDPATFARPEFEEAQATGAFDANMGRLPIFSHGDVSFGQTKAIERYVAKQLGMFGSNDAEAAQIDCTVENVRDIKQKYADCRAGKKDEELAAAKAKFVTEELPKWAEKLEKSIPGTAGFAVGDKISLADVAIFNVVADYMDDKEGVLAAFAACPKALASVEKVKEAAAEWLAGRPETAF